MLINLRNALMAGKRLPYDAEVEYLRVDAVGPYIVIDGVTYCNAVGTYYAFTISSGGVVTHDLIPVRLGNTGYMYDRITNKRFGNAGTGDFVLGPDVVPVEYIESHGTEYIDTDIVAADDVGYELRLVYWQSLWPSTVNFIFAGVFGRSNPYGLGYTGRPNAPRTNVFMWWNSAFANLGTIGAISNGYLRFNFLNSRSYDFNGVISGSLSGSYNASNTTIRLLNAKRMDTGENAFPNSVPAKISAFKISKDNAPARSFRPVRVGTDATSWEGAMIDTLTRRIYRNAGTGAFTYGNDLKYPIPAE